MEVKEFGREHAKKIVLIPGCMMCWRQFDKMNGYARFALKHMLPAEKKYPHECAEARRDCFRRVLRFIEEW